MDFHFDFKNALTLFLKQQNPYLWIDNLIGGKKDRVLEPDVWYDKDVYEGIINGFPFFERLEESVGRLEIIKGETGYSLLNERLHILNEERARETIKKAFESLEPVVDLEASGCYENLPLTAEMLETLSLWEKLKEYQDCGIVYQFGEESYPVDGAVVCDFLLMDDAGNFVFDNDGNLCTDNDKVYEFVDRLADEYDTVGGSRQFRATRGDIVTVEGGIYGNKIDREAEKAYLLSAFLEKRKEVHEPVYTQTR